MLLLTVVAGITQTVKEGQTVKRGDEIGYFSFGGSTIVALFEPGKVQFDEDILYNSSQSIETLVCLISSWMIQTALIKSLRIGSCGHANRTCWRAVEAAYTAANIK